MEIKRKRVNERISEASTWEQKNDDCKNEIAASDDPKEKWNKTKQIIGNKYKEQLKPKYHKNKEWMTDEILRLIIPEENTTTEIQINIVKYTEQLKYR